MDFGSRNPAPRLQDHLQQIPAMQEIEPVALTFADVHKRTLRFDRGSRGDGSGNRGGGFGGRKSSDPATDYLNCLTAPDFSYYSNLGAGIENPSFAEAEGYANILGWRPGAKPVGNIVTYSRDNAHALMLSELNNSLPVGDLRYYCMTDDEVDIYNYLLAKEGEDSAQRYLDFLEEELNKRLGVSDGETIREMENPVVRTLLTGTTAACS